nr:hypothetical protein Iba_chr13cCG17960 [Ipomoea batatas]
MELLTSSGNNEQVKENKMQVSHTATGHWKNFHYRRGGFPICTYSEPSSPTSYGSVLLVGNGSSVGSSSGGKPGQLMTQRASVDSGSSSSEQKKGDREDKRGYKQRTGGPVYGNRAPATGPGAGAESCWRTFRFPSS